MSDSVFSAEDIKSALEKGFKDASSFLKSSPSEQEILDRVKSLRFAGNHAIDNFHYKNYRDRENALKPEISMKKMLLCAFRACEELKVIEGKAPALEPKLSSMIRASYLDIQIFLPIAVTVFRTKGQSNNPDYSVNDQVIKADCSLRVA